MSAVHNFSAGPAMLPRPVLERVRAELLDADGSGMSAMEWSHRGPEFGAALARAEQGLRRLLGIPAAYRVLFLQGGATLQFAMVPLNLRGGATRSVDYFDTGHWSAKAIAEAKRFGPVNVAVDGKAHKYTTVPEAGAWRLDPQAAFVHFTPNETIAGVELSDLPAVGAVPLVADLSSTILSQPIDVSRHALIYAGAQKNIGPAGLTVVILREDALSAVPDGTASMLDYRAHLQAEGGLLNTPPTFAIWLAGLVFEWLDAEGGVAAMARRNAGKSAKLYGYIDGSGFYRNPVDPRYRSRMNVPFMCTNAALDPRFLVEARAAGLMNLEGHRSVGGMRASLYNAMPEAGVDALIGFMREFARRNG